MDHVIPKSLVKKHARDVAAPWHWMPSLLNTVPCCFPCNMRKGTRRLVPPSWAGWVDVLNSFFAGTPFRVWDGDVRSTAFAAVHLAGQVIEG